MIPHSATNISIIIRTFRGRGIYPSAQEQLHLRCIILFFDIGSVIG